MSISLADFERDALGELSRYTEIPCLSPMFDHGWSQNGHIDSAIELLADWVAQRQLRSCDVRVQRIKDRTPLLVVTIGATGPEEGTVVIYGHCDKQPPLGEWSEGLDPFRPVRRGNRLYGRGVADDGYATFAALLAVEELERQGHEHGRIVVLIEASEESGSPDLDAHLAELSDHLGRVDLMICLDSGALTYDRLWVTTSLRGVVNVHLRVSVLERGVHSGSASGVVPSSFRVLRQLLDRVEDASTGEIRLRDLHATVPETHVTAARAIAEEFGDVIALEMPSVSNLELMGVDAADRILARTWRPTLSVVGMGGIPQPEIAGNVLRPYTEAVLSLRLPPSVDAAVAAEALREVLTTNVPSGAHVEVEFHAASGWASPPLAPWLEKALRRASLAAFGREPGFTGEGGSIPFLGTLAQQYPQVQFVATGVLGPGSNAHGIDEMLDLDVAVGVTNSVVTLLREYSQRQE